MRAKSPSFPLVAKIFVYSSHQGNFLEATLVLRIPIRKHLGYPPFIVVPVVEYVASPPLVDHDLHDHPPSIDPVRQSFSHVLLPQSQSLGINCLLGVHWCMLVCLFMSFKCTSDSARFA
jgi:hypothetical protein|tara:strand:- start:816 stop:1172 length:357 start_codon:yes stop_codon:yes gene_type:complete